MKFKKSELIDWINMRDRKNINRNYFQLISGENLSIKNQGKINNYKMFTNQNVSLWARQHIILHTTHAGLSILILAWGSTSPQGVPKGGGDFDECGTLLWWVWHTIVMIVAYSDEFGTPEIYCVVYVAIQQLHTAKTKTRKSLLVLWSKYIVGNKTATSS